MRKLLVSVAVATATIAAVGAPAAAEAQSHARSPYRPVGPGRQQVNELLRDLGRAEARIDRAPGISRREAAGLRRQAGQIRVRLNWALRNDGRLGMREFASLRAQVNRLEQRVRMERRDRDNRRH
jgi:hypothetical protein